MTRAALDTVELVNLYHLAQTALARQENRGRHARMIWASKAYAKAHGVTRLGAYKALDRALVHGAARAPVAT